MDKQELIGKLGYLLDSTKMQHVKWVENEKGIFANQTNKVRIASHAVEINGDCTNECEELRTRLFKAAKRSAVANKKTYEDRPLQNIVRNLHKKEIRSAVANKKTYEDLHKKEIKIDFSLPPQYLVNLKKQLVSGNRVIDYHLINTI